MQILPIFLSKFTHNFLQCGIVQQTTKRNMIAVPIFQFVPANALPIFQLGAANAVPNFQFVAAIAVPNFEFGAANAAPS